MTILERQLANNNLSNAYIIEGEDIGYNLDYSLEFAKEVFDSYAIKSNINPDLSVIDKEIIDITTIRSLIKDMVIRPTNGKIKIYIIHNAQNLRVEAANAMLKSLEELRDYVLVIFTTDNSGKILPTIRSRCQIISLTNRNYKKDIDFERLSDIIREIYEGNLSFYYKERDYLLAYKENKDELISSIIEIFRGLIDFKYKDNKPYRSSYAYNLEKLSMMDLNSIERLISKLEEIQISYRNNINFELSIENIFFNIYREGRQGKWM